MPTLMSLISIDFGDMQSRAPRFPIRLAVAVGRTAETAVPWGIACDLSSNGLYIRTRRRVLGERVRLWFADQGQLRRLDARVARRGGEGYGVSFADQTFFHWAFDRAADFFQMVL
jgi:hypothetical protein